ncbi:IclR family transcriptional regulator [Corynebacterium sanguinis]|uniref:IclR family transcriptional regulator n=1 Tax=Corynebacterium sanguinis TaxID=2594913 RepID=UPI00119E5252|nr:IclR family transcriptional regulator [Corynebacterium sanguinis]MCT1614244.1 IclR family transcriptional regulator [Corynebacterium sanguinis]TVS26313.1 IclR family transcriptional regulator [Corynebacterium sanguinis]
MATPHVPAAHNTLRILSLLSQSDAPLSAARIQRELELPRSSTYHLLRELEHCGFVVHLANPGTYGLGPAAYEMAAAYTTQQPLVRLAAKDLEAIAAHIGGSTHLSRMAGSEIVYVHEARAPKAVSLVTEVGVRLPALSTASGRAMVAHLPDAEVKAVFSTSGEHGTFRAVRARLKLVRERGWDEEREQVSRGQESVAVAVLDHLGRPAAALAATFAVGSRDEEQRAEVIGRLSTAAGRVSERFFGGV